MPALQQDEATPDPEPEGISGNTRPSFVLLHVPSIVDNTRYQPWLSRLAARHSDALVVATVVAGSTPAPPGIAGPAFVLLRAGRVVAEAFGDLPWRELERLVEHALGAAAAPAPISSAA